MDNHGEYRGFAQVAVELFIEEIARDINHDSKIVVLRSRVWFSKDLEAAMKRALDRADGLKKLRG